MIPGKWTTAIPSRQGALLESRWARRKELHLVAQNKKAKKTSLNAQKRQATADARVRSLFVTTMAAAPPAAGATPGTPHTTTTTTSMAAHSITTYAEHYAALPDDLQGRYDRLLAPYDPASGRSHQQLLHRLLSMSDASPKAFVGLVEHSGSYCTVLVHRITLFKSHPVDVSDWDGKALGFGGDVMPGNHIELMEVPEDAFAVAPEHVVPTRENVDHLLSGNPAVEVLGPFTVGDPDTEPLKCRKMVPVPAAYLHLLLDRTLTPRQLWEQVGGGHHRGRQGSGVWGAAQLDSSSPHREKQHGDPPPPPPPPPATLASPILLGRLSEVFPPIRVEPVHRPPSTGSVSPGSNGPDGVTGGCAAARERCSTAGSSGGVRPRRGPEDSYERFPPVRHNLAAQPGGGRRRGFASHLSSVGKLHQGREARRSPNGVQRAGGERSKCLPHYASGHQGALRDGGPGATRLPPVRRGRPLKRS